jgi:hypothetical protein
MKPYSEQIKQVAKVIGEVTKGTSLEGAEECVNLISTLFDKKSK